MKAKRWGAAIALLWVAGCARHAPAPTIAAPAPPPVVEVVPLPPGASPGMLVPQPLADGSFPTPNRGLSAAGTLWHLRAALNVAALSCRGGEGEAIQTGYNAWLLHDRAALAAAASRYAAEYQGTPSAGDFDNAMTRLYNFWSQTPVRTAFCAAAATAMAQVSASDAATLPSLAPAALAALDRPFVDFYRAYDAWRRARAGTPAVASAAPAGAGRSRLTLDLSTLPADPTPASGVSAR